VKRRKGSQVVSRIAAYSSTTPFASSRGLSAAEAFASLYATYRGACDALVKRSALPVLELDAVELTEAQVRERAVAWIASSIAQ
jgi:hypothetical protein